MATPALRGTSFAFPAILVFCLVAISSGLFTDFLYLQDLKRLDFQRILLCLVLAVFVPVHAACALYYGVAPHRYSSLIWFFPVAVSFIGHYLYFDQYSYFPFEGMMFLSFFLVAGLNGNVLRESIGIVGAATALVYAAMICSAFYAALTLIKYTFILNDAISPTNLIPWGFVNIRFWSHLATWLLPLFPLATLIGPFRNHNLWRWATALTAAVWWWVVIMSSAHGTMVALAISFVFIAVFYRPVALEWLRVFSVYLLLGMLLWVVLSVVLPSVLSQSEVKLSSDIASSTPIRMIMWKEAFAMSLVNFPFGMGGQAWLTHEPLTQPYITGSIRPFGAPHNMYLLWAAEYGWVSVLALGLPFSYAVIRLIKARASMSGAGVERNAVVIAVVASVLAALMHSGVSSVLLTPAAALAGLLVLSLFWGIILPEPSTNAVSVKGDNALKKEYRSLIKSRLFWAVVFAGSIWFGVTFMEEVFSYHEAMRANWECFPEQTKLGPIPRFWQHGYYPNPLDYQCD